MCRRMNSADVSTKNYFALKSKDAMHMGVLLKQHILPYLSKSKVETVKETFRSCYDANQIFRLISQRKKTGV